MARRSGRSFARPFRPSGGWAGVCIPNTFISGNAKVLLALFVPLTGAFTLTIRRIRLSLMWSSDQAAATEEPDGAIGAAILSDTAIAVGVASLPDPITDIGDDIWMMYQGLNTKVVFSDATGVDSNAGRLYEIDSKAMRKIPEGMSLAFICATASAQGARVQGQLRLYVTQARA